MKSPTHKNSRKGRANVIVLLLLAAVVGLSIWIVRLRREVAETEVQPLSRETRRPAERPAATPAPEPVPMPAASESPPAAAPAEKAANPMVALMEQTMKNPAMRQMLEAQLRRRMETQYAEMFGVLGLSEEQRGRFIEMMIGMTTDVMNGPMQRMLGGQPGASAQDSARQLIAERAAAEQKMADFWATEFPGDPSKYEAFKRFDETQTDRRNVDAFRATLAQSGEPLTAEQREAMVAINYEERRNQARPATSAEDRLDLGKALSTEAMASSAERTRQIEERVEARAASVLSPNQLAALREHHAARAKQSEAGAQMMKAMMGAGAPAKQ